MSKDPLMPTVKRKCGCSCNGCLENTSNHCLQPPCKRKRNRRTQAEIEADGRFPSGLPKPNKNWASYTQEAQRVKNKDRYDRGLRFSKRKEPLPPPQRVVYPFSAKAPSGRVMELYGNSESERNGMIVNLERHGYECIVPVSTGLGVGEDTSTEDGGQST